MNTWFAVVNLTAYVSAPYDTPEIALWLTFNPTPPAFKLTIIILGLLEGTLKLDTAALLFFTSMVPSNLCQS